MPNPIAFVDTSYLKGIVLNKNNIPVAVALARLKSLYELHITDQVVAELTNDYDPDLRAFLDTPAGNYTAVEASLYPQTDALLADGAVTSNKGDFATWEAAKNYNQPIILSDDAFFNKVYTGEVPPSGFVKNATGGGAIAVKDAASKPGRFCIGKPTGAIKTVHKAAVNIARASGATGNGGG